MAQYNPTNVTHETDNGAPQEVQCSECGNYEEVTPSEEIIGITAYWFATWRCANCDAPNEYEGEYDLEDPFGI